MHGAREIRTRALSVRIECSIRSCCGPVQTLDFHIKGTCFECWPVIAPSSRDISDKMIGSFLHSHFLEWWYNNPEFELPHIVPAC